MSLLAPENLEQPVQDRILMLLQAGHQRNDVFKDIYIQCWTSLKTKAQKQHLADFIAQIDSRSVFATGWVPEGLEELQK